MSFILDALRKSEARRQAGQTPRLNDEPDSGSSGRLRRARWISGLIAVAVVAGVAIAGVWYIGPAFQDPPETLADSEPVDRVPQTPVEPVDTPTPATATGDAESSSESSSEADQTEPEAGGNAQSDQQAPDEAQSSSPRNRRTLRPASEERSATREAPSRERVVTDSDEAVEEIEREIAQAREQSQTTDDQAPAPDEPAAADPEADVEQDDDDSWRPEAGEYVRAWELPLSVRRKLPELQLTIHVFSPEEGTRFVLINGERYVPGDELATDTKLVDIRREGAIVDFRDHRFLLEP